MPSFLFAITGHGLRLRTGKTAGSLHVRRVLEDEPDKKRLNAEGGSYANQCLKYWDGIRQKL